MGVQAWFNSSLLRSVPHSIEVETHSTCDCGCSSHDFCDVCGTYPWPTETRYVTVAEKTFFLDGDVFWCDCKASHLRAQVEAIVATYGWIQGTDWGLS